MRIVLFILVLAVLLTNGCGSNSGTTTNQDLERRVTALEQRVNDLEQNSGIEIDLEFDKKHNSSKSLTTTKTNVKPSTTKTNVKTSTAKASTSTKKK